MQVPTESSNWRFGEKSMSSYGGSFLNAHRTTTLNEFCSFYDFGTHAAEVSRLGDETLTMQSTTRFVDEENLNDRIKSETSFGKTSTFSSYSPTPCPMNESKDLFDMSSFFRDHEDEEERGKNDCEQKMCCEDSFEDLLEQGHGSLSSADRPLNSTEQQVSGSSDTVVEELLETDTSVDSVVMGIPYYVACQWQQMQQQQQQQQQAVMMLWWQAYLSGAYNMMGPKGMAASGQVGWSFPHTGLTFPGSTFPGSYNTSFDDESLYRPMMLVHDDGTNENNKRRRNMDGLEGMKDSEGCNGGNKKGRRSRQNERVCKNCGTNATPFWRKDKQDGRPLCNACGLYLSKNDAPRPKVLWKYNERSPVVLV